jgi:uncharacterized DUF497 family protein
MRYEWDSAKDAENRRKHGFGLEDGIPVLEDWRSVSRIDDRFDYGEERDMTIGWFHREFLFVVSTIIHDDLTRIISVRKAVQHEEYWFYHDRT